MMNPILKLALDPAKMYVVSKGRLPKDAKELVEWLNEFADFETKRCDSVIQAYQDHMNVCNRPIIIKKGEL